MSMAFHRPAIVCDCDGPSGDERLVCQDTTVIVATTKRHTMPKSQGVKRSFLELMIDNSLYFLLHVFIINFVDLLPRVILSWQSPTSGMHRVGMCCTHGWDFLQRENYFSTSFSSGVLGRGQERCAFRHTKVTPAGIYPRANDARPEVFS